MSSLREKTIRLAKEHPELQDYLLPILTAKDDGEKDSKFEKGEDVPLSALPKEVAENAKNPPPSVQKVKEKIKQKNKGKKAAEDDLYTAAVKLAKENPAFQDALLPVLREYRKARRG